jgi:hypothetical protein
MGVNGAAELCCEVKGRQLGTGQTRPRKRRAGGACAEAGGCGTHKERARVLLTCENGLPRRAVKPDLGDGERAMRRWMRDAAEGAVLQKGDAERF